MSSRVLAPDAPDDVADTLAEKAAAARAQTVATAAHDDVARFRTEVTGVLALIQVDHSDEFDALARLWRPPSPSLRGGEKPGQEKVVLTDLEASAYGRLVDRCLAAWQPGDPLARFVYKGR